MIFLPRSGAVGVTPRSGRWRCLPLIYRYLVTPQGRAYEHLLRVSICWTRYYIVTGRHVSKNRQKAFLSYSDRGAWRYEGCQAVEIGEDAPREEDVERLLEIASQYASQRYTKPRPCYGPRFGDAIFWSRESNSY